MLNRSKEVPQAKLLAVSDGLDEAQESHVHHCPGMFLIADRLYQVAMGSQGEGKDSSYCNIPRFFQHFNILGTMFPQNRAIKVRVLEHVDTCNSSWMCKVKFLDQLIGFVNESCPLILNIL